MQLSEYDLRVLCALDKIQNGDEIKTEDLTSWVIVKKMTSSGKKARELENSSVVNSLKKMNKLGLINLEVENLPTKIRKVWAINCNNVKFCTINFPEGKKKSVVCKIDEKLLAMEI
jgi:hypothetical protein